MLLQFSFKNFGPFKNEAVLNLMAAPESEYKEQVRLQVGRKVLPAAVIFGANASGKSSVYEAFEFMGSYILTSVNYDGNKIKDDFGDGLNPFLLDGTSAGLPSKFEILFSDRYQGKEKIFQYGFTLTKSAVVSEWLYLLSKSKTAKPKKILERYGQKITLTEAGIDESVKKTVETSTQERMLVASLGAKLKIASFASVLSFFVQFQNENFGNINVVAAAESTLPSGIVDDPKEKDRCVAFLQTFEKSIKDIETEELPSDEKDKKKYHVFVIRNDAKGNRVRFSMNGESAGTRKMFALYGDLQFALSQGSVIFIDELNAKLHPLLVRNVLLTFLDPEKNTRGAQLIFTCHDPWLLRAGVLRRDEIYFTNKTEDSGEAILYSLADFIGENGKKIRSDEDFEKNYLLGKYDGIPILEPIQKNETSEESCHGVH